MVILVIAPKAFKFIKLVEIMETKGNKILCNIKTRWISMINRIKQVLSEDHTSS